LLPNKLFWFWFKSSLGEEVDNLPVFIKRNVKIVRLWLGSLARESTTGNLQTKRRELIAPCLEAPRSACTESTTSRAHLGALGRFLCGLGKFAVF
jgi:hypothetical protein